MKWTFFLCTLLFVFSVSGQEATLKPFEFEKFMVTKEGSSIIKNPVYQYLTQNYTAISEKQILPSNGVGDCGFTQSFNNGLTYVKRNCGDAALATGEVLEVINPDRASLILWVESFNKMYGDFDQNLWNFDQSQYVPVGGIQGAYFEIIRGKRSTTILVMSGC